MMRYFGVAAVFCLSVALHATEASNLDLSWVKVSSTSTLAGTFTRTADGIEIYSFREKLCMVTYGPKGSATEDVVVLPATEGSDWTFTKSGIVVVSPSAILARPVYFALVRWANGEGLLRLQAADDVPPQHIPSRLLESLVYRRETSPNNSPEATPGQRSPVEPNPSSGAPRL